MHWWCPMRGKHGGKRAGAGRPRKIESEPEIIASGSKRVVRKVAVRPPAGAEPTKAYLRALLAEAAKNTVPR
jgi:hypothetical protein